MNPKSAEENNKIRAELNKIENRKTHQKNTTKQLFFEKINKIDKLLARLIKEIKRKDSYKQNPK